MKFLAATGNKHKLSEFTRILAPLDIEVISPKQAGVDGDIEETGLTFAENAKIKAAFLFKLTGIPAFADDSGLCVDALDGRPGVYSKRYMNGAPPEKQIAGLLKEMENVPPGKRTARFTAAICCVLGDGDIIEVEESCEGEIAHFPSGNNGFGYDPIFLYNGTSFSDLSDGEKDEVSHRGKALRELVRLIEVRIKEKN